MKRLLLARLLETKETAIRYFRDKGILLREQFCSKCDRVLESGRSPDSVRCNNRIDGKRCNKEATIYRDSMFYRVNVDCRVVIFLLYEWGVDTPVHRAAFEYACDPSTASRWYRKFRKIALLDRLWVTEYAIGGPGTIVEIDETCIVKSKNHQGRRLRYQKWFFGGVVRGDSAKCFLEHVDNRSQKTLFEVILRRVLPGTTIMSDCWRGYNNLAAVFPEYNFIHLQVS